MQKSGLIFLICFSFNAGYAVQVNLKQAFEKKYISAKAICTGGLELNYTISSKSKETLVITIPAGWRFVSDGGKNDYQDIFLAHEQILTLKPQETKNFKIKGYCCEASKAGPLKGVPYTNGSLADSSLVLLARYLNAHPADSNTEQYAVWAISDKKETANITGKQDSAAMLLRNYVSTLKGEPLPWYTLLKRAYVSASGTVQDQPIRFRATIPYSVSETCYSYCYIVDDKGNKVSEIFGRWLAPAGEDYRASFNVASLKKGAYKLVLENKKEALFERSFSI